MYIYTQYYTYFIRVYNRFLKTQIRGNSIWTIGTWRLMYRYEIAKHHRRDADNGP